MPEPLCEQIVAALVDRLEGIVGDGGATFWYTPTHVQRSPAWGEHCLPLRPADDTTVYTLSPDDEDMEELTLTSTRAFMGIDLTIARPYRNGDNPFEPAEPDRWKVQNRMRDDARKRLRGELKVGNLALLIQIPLVDLSAEETFVDGWAVVMMRLVVQYSYGDAS